MGYPRSSHIRKFVSGKTITELSTDEHGFPRFIFSDGESLRIYATIEHGKPDIIATPFQANGEVKQSTVIEAASV